jgi:hypothetical protein
MLICDSATIYDLPNKIFDRLKWNFIKRCDQIVNNCQACRQVTFIEIVQNVPSQWTELASLQNYRMEKTQIKRKGLLLFRFAPIDHIQYFLHVRLYPSRRLACDLDTVLQYGPWEIIAGHAREV